MKLRWKIVETQGLPHRPSWPKTMSYGKPWQEFHHTKQVLQYQGPDGDWHDIETVVIKEVSEERKKYDKKQEDAFKKIKPISKAALKQLMKGK